MTKSQEKALEDLETLRWLLNKSSTEDTPRMTIGSAMDRHENSRGESNRVILERLYKTVKAALSPKEADQGKDEGWQRLLDEGSAIIDRETEFKASLQPQASFDYDRDLDIISEVLRQEEDESLLDRVSRIRNLCKRAQPPAYDVNGELLTILYRAKNALAVARHLLGKYGDTKSHHWLSHYDADMAAVNEGIANAEAAMKPAIEAVIPEGQWQPIKTAPKDRRFILALHEGKVHRICSWSRRKEKWEIVGAAKVSFFNPTHWMPLPTPPMIEAAAIKDGGG